MILLFIYEVECIIYEDFVLLGVRISKRSFFVFVVVGFGGVLFRLIRVGFCSYRYFVMSMVVFINYKCY